MNMDQDERLAAWLDGALDAEAARAFEAEMAADPALAAKAASWRANDAFIAGAFAPLADAAPDPALLARLGLNETAPMPSAANDNPPWWRGRVLPLVGGALAAGLALVLVIRGQTAELSRDPLSLALDTTPSLQTAKLADGRTIQPRLTVRAADGRWCREYASGAAVALACRDADGWKVIGEGPDSSAPADPGAVVLAGGSDNRALDQAYASIGAQDPLGQQEEQALIAGGWAQR